MKTWKIITIITLATIGAALVTTAAFATAYNPYQSMVPTQSYYHEDWNNQATGTQYPNDDGYCCSAKKNYNNYVIPETENASLLTIDQATQAAQQYVTALNNPDLKVGQVEEYANYYHVQVNEVSTGNGAFELLVDKATGNVFPEMGPNMMWNTKYTTTTGVMEVFTGMGGMMGFHRTAYTPMTVTEQQATTNAQNYLDTYFPETTVGNVAVFHGYYGVEILSNGQPYGMLGVNGYNGQVWYHNWACGFVQEQIVG
ncbi:MAG: hypothetical protein ACQCN3_04215 [Candidatus Bathyarchaeia archaeon]|jgi:hypothetical protein